MAHVTIEERNIAWDAPEGASLYEQLARRGLMEGPCGGHGRCGKCRVRVLTPYPAAAEEQRFFTERELADGWRLACLHTVEGDMTIALPEARAAGSVLSQGLHRTVETDGEDGFGVAVDIGTTTVAACLVRLSDGQRLADAACLNSQRAFGQDVITRIDYAMREGEGLDRMQAAILSDLRMLTAELLEKAGLSPLDIRRYAVAANNVMTHIFGGKDPSSLAAYPFSPAFTGALKMGAAELGLAGAADAAVRCLPAVSSYVGGDITAGMLTCEIGKQSGNVLFLDIGTNGEMVLSREGTLYSCSCAAGPALEGMDIRCGMRAADGAIEDAQVVWREGVPGWRLQTIGGSAPQGLCGSGLLSAVTELVDCGAVNKTGRLQLHPLVTADGPRRRCVLDKENGVLLTQQDIRQVQLAKGAILAGVEILLQQAGLTASALDRVLVAGQFGAHLTPRSLVGAGLLPQEVREKIEYVGNTALTGAVLCLLSEKERHAAEALAGKVRYLELSAWPDYEKHLMQAMSFRPIKPERFVCGSSLAHNTSGGVVKGWRILPVDNTLLAECLGAKPVADEGGVRIVEVPYSTAEELPPAPDFGIFRLKCVMAELTASQEPVIYQLDGPLTVLSQLLPLGKVFSALRRSDELLRRAEDWVAGYAVLAARRGAAVLSLADPVATLDILGERMFREVYQDALLRLLGRLRRELPEGVVLHLCGKMTQCLLDTGAVTAEKRHYDAATYGQALMQLHSEGKPALLGHFCVHRLVEPQPVLTFLKTLDQGTYKKD